jgi:hypothetical protein
MDLKLVEPVKISPETRESVINILKDLLAQAERGEIVEVNVIYDTVDGKWGSVGSYAKDCRKTAVTLIELGMRRLGFGGGS